MLNVGPAGVVFRLSIAENFAFHISASFCARRNLRRLFNCAFLLRRIYLALRFDEQLVETVLEDTVRSSVHETSISSKIRQSSTFETVRGERSVRTSSTGAFDVGHCCVRMPCTWGGGGDNWGTELGLVAVVVIREGGGDLAIVALRKGK